jgi:rhodanese-related sulfurtransferase
MAELRGESGVIPGSGPMPLSVLVCAYGYASSLAAAALRALGYDRATNLIGEFEAWAAAGLPVVIGRYRSVVGPS